MALERFVYEIPNEELQQLVRKHLPNISVWSVISDASGMSESGLCGVLDRLSKTGYVEQCLELVEETEAARQRGEKVYSQGTTYGFSYQKKHFFFSISHGNESNGGHYNGSLVRMRKGKEIPVLQLFGISPPASEG